MESLSSITEANLDDRADQLWSTLEGLARETVLELRAVLDEKERRRKSPVSETKRFSEYLSAMEAIEEVLRERGEPMSLQEIEAAVLHGGFAARYSLRERQLKIRDALQYGIRAVTPQLKRTGKATVWLVDS